DTVALYDYDRSSRFGSTYLWSVDGSSISTGKDATHTFDASGSYSISFRVNDGGRTCTAIRAVGVRPPFPEWEEVTQFKPNSRAFIQITKLALRMNIKSTIGIVASLLVGFVGGAVFMASSSPVQDEGSVPGAAANLSNSALMARQWQTVVLGTVESIAEGTAVIVDKEGESFLVPISSETKIQRLLYDQVDVNPVSSSDLQEGDSIQAVIATTGGGEIRTLMIYIFENR
ncbi:MAG: PKD domain-containing protein, partial [bacterium]|nr:PKD domain-containing protein [bacterium]